eukprot:CAMPEP_0198219586 /NCGR_PEP_ID=MMETSP1445-20131203/75092_1 /TAXON_ID=36898 /ORGANISM="Pyramimonas sp., Strain CCMP2087" /LENGTH=127 /DNA_ID=CAMNT_0043897039 /DNA_START=783 /DNA_END=1166 /DNA_ORIENTATION=-
MDSVTRGDIRGDSLGILSAVKDAMPTVEGGVSPVEGEVLSIVEGRVLSGGNLTEGDILTEAGNLSTVEGGVSSSEGGALSTTEGDALGAEAFFFLTVEGGDWGMLMAGVSLNIGGVKHLSMPGARLL